MEDIEGVARTFEHAAGKIVQDMREALVDANSGKNVFQMAYEQLMGFVSAINWREPWIVTLCCTELFLVLLVLFTRKHTTFQACLFVVLGLLVYCAKYINAYCEKNWELFATQPYFDNQGLFISAMVSGPLLVINIIIVVNHLIELSRLIVKVKRAELRAKSKAQKKKD
jgi:hypothetical protein